MGPTWVLSAPDGPHVAPMNLAIRDHIIVGYPSAKNQHWQPSHGVMWSLRRNSHNCITDHSAIKSKLIDIPIYPWFARTSADVITKCSDKQFFAFHEDFKYLNHSSIKKLLKIQAYHYSDVMIDTMTTSVMIVHSTVCSGADQRKYQSSASLAVDRWIPRTKGQ